ncbi:hypothetical protein SDC9_95224 [bioreactor metagenome]|uniref:HTH luxR-type domain-containing protein n=1 Tax=bioreactor metagenome TaxID=1076179 RepID=A0A645A5Q6_9ZZZZ
MSVRHSVNYDRIAGLLYDGVLSPLDWHAGIDAMRGALNAGFFNFFTLNDGDAQVMDSVDNLREVGISGEPLRQYHEHFVAEDVRMDILMRLPAGEVMLDHEHISAREMSRNAVYVDFLRANGFFNTLGALVRDSDGTRDFIGFIRPLRCAQYNEKDKQLIQQLMPTLMRASRLRAHVKDLSRCASLGISALHALPQGMAVVDAQGHIQYANPAAERLMMAPSAVRSTRGRLQCANGELQARLAQIVAQACGNPGQAGAVDASMSTSQAARLVVTVLPLKPSHVLAMAWQRPLALVILTMPGAITALDHRMVGDMLGLSPSEARLLLILAAGKSVKDFAAVEGCSWHTARTHMKNLMRKTGCHRQVELVQLLQALQVG